MGRGKQEEIGDSGVTRRGAVPAVTTSTDKLLSGYERTVLPMWHRFASAATRQATAEDIDKARARRVNKMPYTTQIELIEVAQGATAITEILARTVKCPDCSAEVGRACAGPRKERKISHPSRLRLARESSQDKAALSEVARAQAIGAKARELFIYSHTGWVIQKARSQVGAFESESKGDAMRILRQESFLALHEAIDRYDPDYVPEHDEDPVDGAVAHAVGRLKGEKYKPNPLTFAKWQIMARVSEAKEQGLLISTKARAFDERQRVQAAAKGLASQGKTPSVEEIARLLDLSPERVVLHMNSIKRPWRIDIPVAKSNQGKEAWSPAHIADPGPTPDEEVMVSFESDAVRAAAQKLPAFERRLVEMNFGFTDREGLEQKDLYDGVYIDPATGERFTSEPPVLTARNKNGEEVTKASQKDLNRRFKAGELVFEAGTPESFELATLRGASKAEGDLVEPTPKERLARIITKDSGGPLSSGIVQDILEVSLGTMTKDPDLRDSELRYRGSHELQRSEDARKMARKALAVTGVVSPVEAKKLVAGRASDDGNHKPGPLVQMVAEQGWLDDDGSVNWRRLREDVARHKASLLSQRGQGASMTREPVAA